MPTFRNHSFAAFLFDMDGTLLDSSVVTDRVWRAWATRHGVDAANLMAHMHGVRSEDTIRRFGPPGTDVAKENAWVLQAELDDVEGLVEIAGARAFIDTLEPGTWAVVTSATRSLAEVRLRAAGLPIPDVMVTADDVKRGKPDPEGFLTAARRLGARIEDCLVFEDSPAGVAAAKSAGASVAIVGNHVPAGKDDFAISNYRE